MDSLKLDFLNRNSESNNLAEILDQFGKEISNYAIEYFNYAVTSTSDEGELLDLSLYIIAPEIKFEYKAIAAFLLDISNVQIEFYTLITKQKETLTIDISKGSDPFKYSISKLLSSDLFNASLDFLVSQVHLKREYSELEELPTQIRDQIDKNVTIIKDTSLYSIVTGNVRISPNNVLTVFGMIKGNVEIEQNGKLILQGIVNGNIHISQNGKLELNGILNGNILGPGESEISGVINRKST